MKASRCAYVCATIAVALIVAPAAWAQKHDSHMVVTTPKDLKWVDVPSLPPGAKVAMIEGPMNQAVPFTVRIKLPANYKIPAHSHEGIEHVTVLSGTVNMGMGDKLDMKKTKALPLGGIAIMQPKTNHYLWTKEEAIVQVHGVGPWVVNYADPADDPRKKK